MRGAARLACSSGWRHPDLRPPDPERAGKPCCVCGEAGEGIGRNTGNGAGNPNGAFSSSFTDDAKLVAASAVMCNACFTIAKMATRSDNSPINITAVPKGCPGWLLADGAITALRGGPAGIADLAGLSERTQAFAVMVGWGNPKNTAHHWISTPVAYPAPRWPALYIDGNGGRITWMSTKQLGDIVEAVQAAGLGLQNSGADVRKALYGRGGEVGGANQAVSALRDLLAGSGDTEELIKKVLFYGKGE